MGIDYLYILNNLSEILLLNLYIKLFSTKKKIIGIKILKINQKYKSKENNDFTSFNI